MPDPAVNVDSLLRVIVERNGQLADAVARADSIAAAVPDTIVRVAQPFIHRPWHDGLVPVLLGGLLAAGGGFGAQWFREVLDRRRTKRHLILRIRLALETAATTFRSTLKTNETKEIHAETMNGIIVEWGRYDRVSDHLWLLEDPLLESEIETVLHSCRCMAEKAIDDERRYRETRREAGRLTPEGIEVTPTIQGEIIKHREEIRALMRTVGRQVEETLTKFDAKWPPVRSLGKAPSSIETAKGEG